MKKSRRVSVILLSILAVFLLSAAAPLAVQQAGTTADQDFIRLTVNNRNDEDLQIRLEGPAVYLLSVAGEKRETFTVQKGTYTYWLTACGATVKGTLDMNVRKTLVMPVCGGNVKPAGEKINKIDLSTRLKVVPASISNETGVKIVAILTGPATYVLTFDRGEEKDVTLVRGDYTIRYPACNQWNTWEIRVDKGSTLELTCPRP